MFYIYRLTQTKDSCLEISSGKGIKEVKCRHHKPALCFTQWDVTNKKDICEDGILKLSCNRSGKTVTTIGNNCLYENRILFHGEYVQLGDTMVQCVKGKMEKLRNKINQWV